MTYQELKELLDGLGILFAFGHWEDPPPMPYGVYFDDRTDTFAADGAVYFTSRHFNIELYVRQRDEALEGRLEDIFDTADLYWEKDSAWVDDLRAYQIAYEIEV